jgi:hypothetical protein
MQVAMEMTAAIACGQWIIIYGSISRVVADMIAHVLCETPLYVLPSVDLIAPLTLPETEQNDVRLIVLDGANRVPVEVVAGSLREQTIAAQMGLTHHVSNIVVAVCENGAASLPLRQELLELGPFICTDGLQWKKKHSRKAPLQGGRIVIAHEEVEKDGLGDLAVDEQLKESASRAWSLARKRFLAAMKALGATEERLNIASRAAWGVPLLIALGRREEELEREGMRIKRMLALVQ